MSSLNFLEGRCGRAQSQGRKQNQAYTPRARHRKRAGTKLPFPILTECQTYDNKL